MAAACAYGIGKKLELERAWAIAVLCLFAPIYYGVMNSGLTEPLFSLALIFSILLVFQKKYDLAALVFSFAPLVRPEANFMLLIFIFYFVIRKKFRAVPLLLTGTIIYSIIGYFYFHDIFWLKTQNPYNDANAQTYGQVHGELFHYFLNYENITGLPLALLICAGI